MSHLINMADENKPRLFHRDRTFTKLSSSRRRWSTKIDASTDKEVNSRVNNGSVIEDDSTENILNSNRDISNTTSTSMSNLYSGNSDLTTSDNRKIKRNVHPLDIRSKSSLFLRHEAQHEDDSSPPTPDPALLGVREKLILFETMEAGKWHPGTLSKYKSKSSDLLLTSERKCVSRWEKYPQKLPPMESSLGSSQYNLDEVEKYRENDDIEQQGISLNSTQTENESSAGDLQPTTDFVPLIPICNESSSAGGESQRKKDAVSLLDDNLENKQTNDDEPDVKLDVITETTSEEISKNEDRLEYEMEYPKVKLDIITDLPSKDISKNADRSDYVADYPEVKESPESDIGRKQHFHRTKEIYGGNSKPWVEAVNKPFLSPAFIKYLEFENDTATTKEEDKAEVKEQEEEVRDVITKPITTDLPDYYGNSQNSEDNIRGNDDLWAEALEPSEEMLTKSLLTPDLTKYLNVGKVGKDYTFGGYQEEQVIANTQTMDLPSPVGLTSHEEDLGKAPSSKPNIGSSEEFSTAVFATPSTAVNESPLSPVQNNYLNSNRGLPIAKEDDTPAVEEMVVRNAYARPVRLTSHDEEVLANSPNSEANIGSNEELSTTVLEPSLMVVNKTLSTPPQNSYMTSDNGVAKATKEDIPEVEEMVVREVVKKPKSNVFTRNYRSLFKIGATQALQQRGVKFNSLQLQQEGAPNQEDQIDILHKGFQSIQPILEELIKTEKAYVQNLWTGLNNYGKLFERKDLPKGLKGKKYVLFANIEQIAEFHRDEFLPMLQRNCHDLKRIFDEFQKYIEQNCFYGYVIYAMNNQRSLILCNSYEKYFKMLQAERNDSLGINSFLLQPIQRIARYPLLLKEFIKKLFDNYPLKSTIDSCCRLDKKLQNLLMATNKSEVINDLMSISETHEFNIFYQGKFRDVNEFHVVDHTLKRSYHSKVFIYDKCIIYTEIKRKELIFRGRYPLEHIGVIVQTKSFTLYYERRKQQECDFVGDPALVKHCQELIHELVNSYVEEEKARLKMLHSRKNGGEPMRRKKADLLLFRDSNRFSMYSGFGNG